MLECYVEGRNIVNGAEKHFDIVEGAVFTENYNETLDSGTIILAQLSSKIEIEPFDVIVISSKSGSKFSIITKRFCVDTFTCVQTCLNPTIYKYEISLFSETKLLEGILLPSLSITKLMTGRRKIYDYLQQYLNEYGTKLYSSETQGAYGNKFSFGHNIKDENDTVALRFGAIDCPEMQWNEPTLREVFTSLMMVDDCIPVIQNNVINFIDISDIGSEITNEQKNYINYITETHSSSDYVSDIKMKLVNSANNSMPSGDYFSYDSENLPKDKTTICEEIGFRNDNTYIISDETMMVNTSFPIWKLFYCEYIIKIDFDFDVYENYGTPNATIIATVNYNDNIAVKLLSSAYEYILEKGIWDTKNIDYSPFDGTTLLNNNYQNTCLYYIRGQKGIFNFNAKQEDDFLWVKNQKAVYELMLNASEPQITIEAFKEVRKKYPQYAEYTFVLGANRQVVSGWGDIKFRVAYEPIDECTFIATKSNFPRNKRVIVDNQENNYVDIEKQGFLEYAKANRLGNKIQLVNGRFKCNESQLPQLSQKINNSIIFKKEISVNNNFINVNYQTTENYVLKNYFTSVKSKLRSWKITSGSEAFIRADILKFFVNENIPSINNNNIVMPSYSSLDTYFENFNACVIYFKDKSNNYYPNDTIVNYNGTPWGIDGYLVEFSKHKCGNSVLFTIKMPDNSFVGKYIYNQNGTGGMYQKNAYYVDDDGENVGGYILFYQSAESALVKGTPREDVYSLLMPGINIAAQTYGLQAMIPFNFHKDNKEITQLTIQIELNENANDMFLGKK